MYHILKKVVQNTINETENNGEMFLKKVSLPLYIFSLIKTSYLQKVI